jgi:hypothetical protein
VVREMEALLRSDGAAWAVDLAGEAPIERSEPARPGRRRRSRQR